MTNAAPLSPRSAAPTMLAMDLASNMLNLLVGSANSPLEHIIRERLLDNSGELAARLHQELMAGEPGDTQRTAIIVSSYVRHILKAVVNEAQDKMYGREF